MESSEVIINKIWDKLVMELLQKGWDGFALQAYYNWLIKE